MHIFDFLNTREIDPIKEFNRIELLLNETSIPYVLHNKISLKEWLNKEAFRDISIRRSFTDIDDLLQGIDVYDSKRHLKFTDIEECYGQLYLYCESLLNIFSQSHEFYRSNDKVCKVVKHISDNIKEIIEKTGCKLCNNDEGIIIVENNYIATEAIECIKDDVSLAFAIMEYNRMTNKGNIKRKRDILRQLAAYTEPWNNDFKDTTYDKLYNDSRFLVNEIDIRHNNKESSKDIFTDGWTQKDYETWYDKTYHTILMVIIARKQLAIAEEIKKLKKKKISNPIIK